MFFAADVKNDELPTLSLSGEDAASNCVVFALFELYCPSRHDLNGTAFPSTEPRLA